MSSNVGLSTPRGSGTSGYVQKNHAFLRPRNMGSGAPYPPPSLKDKDDHGSGSSFKQRQPDKAILEHELKREIEVKVRSEEEIEEICEEVRKRLTAEMERGVGSRGTKGSGRDGGKRGFKTHQVHEAAEAKIAESERLRRALGIRDESDRAAGSARGEIERRRERERERD
ncbi:U2-type spliceosomal complex subunit CWC21 [Aspergillus undulatus]|uniref:U2-type spliceosomal complex subunit CWC21 n=1 Tax=Aspergillus undulatus TaxID=1810928 RepID=UPI003CCC96AD